MIKYKYVYWPENINALYEPVKAKFKSKESMLGYSLLQSLLNEIDTKFPKPVFEYTKYGKPYLKNIPLFFNISHSKDIVICAISDEEIGIDIEYLRPFNEAIAKKFFPEIPNNDVIFTKEWVKLESLIKASGKSIFSKNKDNAIQIEEGIIDGFYYSIAKRVK